MASVDAAEKEASEVLHSLLSVERIVKQETRNDAIVGATAVVTAATNREGDENSGLQWHTPVGINTQSLFAEHFSQGIDEQQVVWEAHTVQVEHGTQNINLYTSDESPVVDEPEPVSDVKVVQKCVVKQKVPTKRSNKNKKRKVSGVVLSDPTVLEDSAAQVKERFKRGCDCQEESCFRGLSPESVYKHRLNIAELTKGEHDMYLMGVTKACLANPDITVRHKERRRLRAQYVYEGRRVCLDAFLYLENCTHYQLKRIRKHVMTHGVAPRIHGNHGKKPHNTFSLDIYRHATEFLKQFLETHTGETNINNSKNPVQLPWDITRKNLHNTYKDYGQMLEPGVKLMGYSTFRHFMKEQFPHVRFCKVEPKSGNSNQVNTQMSDMNQMQSNELKIQHAVNVLEPQVQQRAQDNLHKSVITASEVQQVIPLVVQQGNDASATQHHQQTAFIVTPVPQLLPNGSNLVTMQSAGAHTNGTTTTFPYQINTGYVINEEGNIVPTMTNQTHQSYNFSRM